MEPNKIHSVKMGSPFSFPYVVRMINFLSLFTWQNGTSEENKGKRAKKCCITHVIYVCMTFFYTQLVSTLMVCMVLWVRRLKFCATHLFVYFHLASIIWMKWDVANFRPVSCLLLFTVLRIQWDLSRLHNVSAEEHLKQYFSLCCYFHFGEKKNTQWKPKS